MMTSSIPVKPENDTYTGIPTLKILLWLAMVSMVMLFAGLTSGYIVRQAEGNWVVFDLPFEFMLSTVFILLSSGSMYYATSAIQRNDTKGLVTGMIATLGLGLAFTFTQFLAWSQLIEEGIFFVGNPSGSFLYVLTGLHLAHLGAGILYLIYVTFRSIQGKFNSESYLPVQLCAIFWHFLDFLWIYLFIFLYFIR
jgi:cytochrome c oxidase subunit III